MNKRNPNLETIRITILTIKLRLRLNFGMTKALEMSNHKKNIGRMSSFLLDFSGKKN